MLVVVVGGVDAEFDFAAGGVAVFFDEDGAEFFLNAPGGFAPDGVVGAGDLGDVLVWSDEKGLAVDDEAKFFGFEFGEREILDPA